MHLRSRPLRRALLGTALAAGLVGVAAAPADASTPPSSPPQATVHVVTTGLNQPKKLTIAPDGDLIVALSGDGNAPATCTDGNEPSCLDNSGAIDRVTPWGNVKTLIGGLPSVAGGAGTGQTATGPAEARVIDGKLQVLFQNTNIDPTTGLESYGTAGSFLGDLVRFPAWGHSGSIEASFGPFEAANNPDGGAGSGVMLGLESAIDSDPYSFVPYHGGYAVADAAANDLLFVSCTGKISVLAVFPVIPEVAPPGTLGPTQTTPFSGTAQPVPDSVTVGPDGALYVGELGGVPFNTGVSSVYRVVPGHAPTVYATGFTAISDIAFDSTGHLLVLEIDQAGLNDPAAASGGLPTPGAIIRVGWKGSQTMVASTGLEFPTGLAVGPDGWVYVSNYGVLPATGGPGGVSGEIVKLHLGPSGSGPWSDGH
ncbi:MAG TPA: ScyD/ScyE family protein [Acidimicrobiales bacterium]|nr:ScyD/ScyE family protein [Acidimicrobiales bacterium]